MKTLIKNATVVLPTEFVRTSVLIDGSKIADIDPAVQLRIDETFDATGLHLLPGVIDTHVHFREPGLTEKEDLRTATRACVKGGVTSFLEMPNTIPATVSQERLEQKLTLASNRALANYGFYIGATLDNLDELISARRTPGIKIFIGSSTGNMLVDDQATLEQIFERTSLPIAAHCEDETTVRKNQQRFADSHDVANHSRIRDRQAAMVATKRAIDLAQRHNHRFHVVHVSTATEVPLLASDKRLITGEVCPHHLFFNVDDYARLQTRVQMNPSVKTAEDNRGLWQALLDGSIQMIATDHAPHTLEEKAQPYPQSPSGIPAVENSLALMLDQVNKGTCTLHQVVRWMCDAPALIWDIANKGRIAVGFDADLILVDLNKTDIIRDERQASKCGWSPWHGTQLTGWPIHTWVMGHHVFRDGVYDESRMGSEIRFDHSRSGFWARHS